uniref:EMI domain-containing protein n=1 Tax=Poecilia reticulata TaxID=8081 RepID=A0A3P9QEV6_POERE
MHTNIWLSILTNRTARSSWMLPGSRTHGAWNWCPHTVTKTVTCQVQNGTILQRVYQTCRWPQGCSGGSYKTVVRPSYKVVYRTVTSLEWKCCPGFSGTDFLGGERCISACILQLKTRTFWLSGCLNCSRITALSEKLSSLEAKVKAVSESLGKITSLFY